MPNVDCDALQQRISDLEDALTGGEILPRDRAALEKVLAGLRAILARSCGDHSPDPKPRVSGSWRSLADDHRPSFAAETSMLLTDGTLMVHEDSGKNWWRYQPDDFGDYSKGRWTALAPMNVARNYFPSCVLGDGQVLVAGGENLGSDDGGNVERYDPAADTWTKIAVPAGMTRIFDTPCCVLADGRVLFGQTDTDASGTINTAIYDPATGNWKTTKRAFVSNEETWSLLADGSVLTVETHNPPSAVRYVPASDQWLSAGNTSSNLILYYSTEIGPAILRPQGDLLVLGGNGQTGIYAPPTADAPDGSWTAGPTFPAGPDGKLLQPRDAPACLLPNGRVLCVASPAITDAGAWPGPMSFFECDGASLYPVDAAPNTGDSTYTARMLLLPTGEVWLTNSSQDISIYTPLGSADASWRPRITECPSRILEGSSFELQGVQLNGLSQACSYGDDAAMATNYPLVQLKLEDGRVVYCRTFNHSTMGVSRDGAIQSTHFRVPGAVAMTGRAELRVIANGIASLPREVVVAASSPSPFPTIPSQAIESIRQWIGLIVETGGPGTTDGPNWIITPNGIIPIPGWRPEAAQARKAYGDLRAALVALDRIGADYATQLRNEAHDEALRAQATRRPPVKNG
jgi:hypothetical protein